MSKFGTGGELGSPEVGLFEVVKTGVEIGHMEAIHMLGILEARR